MKEESTTHLQRPAAKFGVEAIAIYDSKLTGLGR